MTWTPEKRARHTGLHGDAELGRWIKIRRRALGLTQDSVAASLGVSQRAVSHWEAGAVRIRPRALEALEGLLGRRRG